MVLQCYVKHILHNRNNTYPTLHMIKITQVNKNISKFSFFTVPHFKVMFNHEY